MATQEDADRAVIEAYRAHYGDAAATYLAAEIYKLRLTPSPPPAAFYGFPRFVVVLIALWLALLETADKLPKLFLAFPAYEATLAELHAKMMQPELMHAQVEKAQADAKSAHWQPYLIYTQAQLARKQWMDGGPNDAWMTDYTRHIIRLEPDD